jgi:hypothetical protein
MRRKPGTDMNFRRSLPEIRCLSQGLPHGISSPFVGSPKTVKHPKPVGLLFLGSFIAFYGSPQEFVKRI